MSPELAKLRAQFLRLVAIEAVAIGLAVLFAVLYFAAHLGWALALFVLALACAAAAQVRFIVQFNRSRDPAHP